MGDHNAAGKALRTGSRDCGGLRRSRRYARAEKMSTAMWMKTVRQGKMGNPHLPSGHMEAQGGAGIHHAAYIFPRKAKDGQREKNSKKVAATRKITDHSNFVAPQRGL